MKKAKILIKQFKQGNIQALRGIYDLYRHDLMTLAMALLQDSQGAEDAVHDVFVKLLSAQRTLQIRGSVRGYLMTAVANACRDVLRRKDRGGDPLSDESWQEPPERAVAVCEEQTQLAEALKQLPYEQREVLVLRYSGDLTFKAIAKSQGVSIHTVQGRYRYGLEKLRSLLGKRR